MKLLRIGRGLSLPAEDFIESKSFIVGQSGRGKSGLLKVLEEALVKSRLPFVVFDPAGVAWGIRSSKDGKGPGLPILVIGGPHGDVRLDRKAGAQTARAIVEANVSAIIDFSEEPKAAYREFLTDFCETLYAINDTSRLVVIDEAKEVVPQQIRPDQTRAYDAVERLVRQGRNKGLGVVLCSQRMATVNKDVVTQCGTLFVFGLVGKPDHKTLHEWVEEWSNEEDLARFEEGLAALKPRECWIWSPQAFGLFQKTYVREFETLHPDRTHLRKMGLLATKPVTTDVSTIVEKLKGQLSKVERGSEEKAAISKLKIEIRRLSDELAKRASVDPREVDRLAKSLASREIARYASEAQKRVASWVRQIEARVERGTRELKLAWDTITGPVPTLELPPFVYAPPSLDDTGRRAKAELAPPPQTRASIPLRPRAPSVGSEARGDLVVDTLGPRGEALPAMPRPGELRLLRVLVERYPARLTRGEVATFGGMSPRSGSFTSYLSGLRRARFVEIQGNSIVATRGGSDFLSIERPNPTTRDEVVRMWMEKLRPGAARILEVFLDNYPNPLDRSTIASLVGSSLRSGSFTSYLSDLNRNGLIEKLGDGTIVAKKAIAEG